MAQHHDLGEQPTAEAAVRRPARQSWSDDPVLMRQVGAGSTEALTTLYDRYSRVVFSYAHRILGDRAAAEELLQEVFFRVWQRANAYSPDRGEVITWLLSLTHNLAIDDIRKRGRRPQKAEGTTPELVLANVATGGPTVEDQVWHGALRSDLSHALETLPSAQRDAILLTYFGGLTQREAARVLGAPLGTVKTRLRLGLNKMRAALEASHASAA